MSQEDDERRRHDEAVTGIHPPPVSPLESIASGTVLARLCDDDGNQVYYFDGGSVPANRQHVSILASVEFISKHALWGCYRLTMVDFAQGGSLTTIQEHAFASCGALETIVLPQTLTCIELGAFRYCRSLLEIVIPDSVNTLGRAAFEDCDALRKVTLSQQLTKIEAHTFLNCKALSYMEFPNSIESIGDGAFENCSNLVTVRLSDSLQRIDRRAFCACQELRQLENFPNGISLGEQALESTAVVSSIVSEASLTRNVDNLHLFPEHTRQFVAEYTYHSNGSVADRPDAFAVVIDSTCIVGRNLDGTILEASNSFVPQNAFSNCLHLVYVHLPDSLSCIGNYAFHNCSTLEQIIIPGSVQSIGDRAFQGCKELKTLSLPQSLTQMGPAVFEDCSALEEVSLPRYLDAIPPRCFKQCSSLRNVDIAHDGGLKSIGDAAFHLCRSLEKFVLPKNVETIGPGSFGNCFALTAIEIPASVKTIRLFAFAGCRKMTSIQLPKQRTSTLSKASRTTKSSPLVIENGAFAGCGSLMRFDLTEMPLAVWPMLLEQFQNRQGNFYRVGLSPAGAKSCAFTFLQSQFYQVFEDFPMVRGEGRWCPESYSSDSKDSFQLLYHRRGSRRSTFTVYC